MNTKEVIQFLLDSFSIIEAHDFRVDKVQIGKNLQEPLRGQIYQEDKTIWCAKLEILNLDDIIKLFTEPQFGFYITRKLDLAQPYFKLNPSIYHDSKRPICPICRYNIERNLNET